jgi:hypothetical protein
MHGLHALLRAFAEKLAGMGGGDPSASGSKIDPNLPRGLQLGLTCVRPRVTLYDISSVLHDGKSLR